MPRTPGSVTTSARPPLSRERVLESAMTLADVIGVHALTMRKLAAALDVKPMTLYHHVANKEAILDGMVDIVFSEIDRPPADMAWKPALRSRCVSARAVLARHWWAPPLMESRTSPGPETLAHHDAVLGCLLQAGFSMQMTAHAYALLDSYVYGFALQEANLPATGGEDLAALSASIMSTVPTDQLPHLTQFTAEHVLRPGYEFAAEFEFGLDLILDGLEARAATLS